MGKLTVHALRAVLVVMLAGMVFVQALMVWALATDPEDGTTLPLTPLRVIVILGAVTVQVVQVCVWRLVAMVQRGTVFSHAAFRYVDVVIGAVMAAALLLFSILLVAGPVMEPPGILFVGGAGVAVLGVVLIVLVLRMLLAQAVARDAEAAHMKAELDEVI
ncbi:DUF2975 domain-containing protein [Streptomyces sp. NBC_00820]|uniref:DUF2975 domain-containing protein n=1 Tax=Streptomyces sp. NBC_00820 TaxID=2975842 RepID=UPI002ED620BD|nr:DUF2975 domain-containing protein [Streptomyces sp. NBC_00820]